MVRLMLYIFCHNKKNSTNDEFQQENCEPRRKKKDERSSGEQGLYDD